LKKRKPSRAKDAVNIDDFRYPGPRPQTREAGLVMLADVVEAASRTLENPTPSRIQGLVQNLINKIFSDGQLDYCELTLKGPSPDCQKLQQDLERHPPPPDRIPGQRQRSPLERRKMEVLIENRQHRHRLPKQKIQTTARRILSALGYPDAQLSILIVDDDPDCSEFNLTYLEPCKGPTNVISFPMQEGPYLRHHAGPSGRRGDFRRHGPSGSRRCRWHGQWRTRFDQLLIHGILHLTGYDHVHSEEEAAVMEQKSNELMERIQEEE
jgi:probable rRNA maturation factor